jgi:hypothetical protein
MSFLNIFKSGPQFAPATEDSTVFSALDATEVGTDSETWDLKEPIDPVALDAFWTQVIKDVQKDPEWYAFVED